MVGLYRDAKCREPVSVSVHGPTHPCRFRCSTTVRRKDGDTKKCCRTHANQFVREGWEIVSGM